MDYYQVPSISIVVISDSAIECTMAFGRNVNQHTLFQAASVSKTINALGILTLVHQGRVNLDKDVNGYLKRWKLKHNKNYKEADRITLRNILSHSAGLNVWGFPGYKVNEKLPSLIDVLNGNAERSNTEPVEVIYKPGKNFIILAVAQLYHS